MLLWILGSTFIISLISLIGVFLLGIKDKFMKKIILLLVGLSAGSFIGDAFLHLLPEAVEFDNYIIYIYLILGFCLFFIIERILHWHHCHKGNCDVHTFTHMSLIGDGIHNFIDGLIIAGIFLLPFAAGGFIYIGASYLIPELHEEKNLKKSFLSFLSFLTGICLMILLRIIFE